MKIEKIKMDNREVYKKNVPTSFFAFLFGLIVGILFSMIVVAVIV